MINMELKSIENFVLFQQRQIEELQLRNKQLEEEKNRIEYELRYYKELKEGIGEQC